MSDDAVTLQYWLTTEDNPFDPFTQWEQWYAYDIAQGYNTCSYLARVTNQAPELDGEVNETITNEAIDRILELNLYGNYKKVVKGDYKSNKDQ